MWRGLMILGGVIALCFLCIRKALCSVDGAPDAGSKWDVFFARLARSFHLD